MNKKVGLFYKFLGVYQWAAASLSIMFAICLIVWIPNSVFWSNSVFDSTCNHFLVLHVWFELQKFRFIFNQFERVSNL